ncbi:hypothetical protein NLU13_5364 [Sarocladium strictum]|uniref:Uncharacterized protein n=1 Tax=Sarocladium strictum TaxID=5046 RepID=A0AA39GH32_SARSR|nr:hypothetical protein NLU13_5364 [Sarocladium strictum]
MASSAAPNEQPAVSPQTIPQQITPAPASPAPVQEKQPHSYYGPQPAHQPPPVNYFNQYPQSYGQPLQSYAPPGGIPPPPPGWQPAPQQPLRPEETTKWRNAHIILHVLSFIFALVDICLTLSLLKWGVGSDAFNGDLILLITRWVRTAHRGITPGAHVGVCLIIWLSCIVAGGLLSAVAPWITQADEGRFSSSSCYNPETGYYEACPKDDVDDDNNKPDAQDLATRRGIFYAIIAALYILWALHFTIFVRGCIETQRRNAARRPVVYVPYWAGPAAQGWQPLPQQGPPPAGQSIPMQTRSPASEASPAPVSEVTSPAPSHQVQEYYTPDTQGVAR